jgi:hypothetical protein
MTNSVSFQPVNSSMFDGVAFNEEHWVLSVRFKTGLVLHYQKIPPELYEELMAAESVGKFYNANIKGKFEHLREEAPAKPLLVADKPVDAAADLSQAREPVVFKPRSEGITDMCVKEGDTCAAPDNSPAQQTPQFHAENGVEMADCYVHMKATEHYKRTDGSLVCSLCHPPSVQKPQDEQTGMTKAPTLLEPLEAPKTPEEAIALLTGNDRLIQATIQANREIAQEALTLKVSDAASYTTAGERLKFLTEVKDRAFKFLDPIRQILLKPYQLAQTRLKEATDPIDTALGHVKRQRMIWSEEQDRIRRAEELRLRLDAEEKAEQERQERGTQLTLGAVDDALANGDEAMAEKLIAEPIQAPGTYVAPVFVESAVPVEKGLSKSKHWKARIPGYKEAVKAGELSEEFEKLILDVAEGILDRAKTGSTQGHAKSNCLAPDMKVLNKLANAQEKALSIPGVVPWNDASESVRRKK